MNTIRTTAVTIAAVTTLCCVTAAPDSASTSTETGNLPVVEAFTEPYRDIAVAAGEMGTVASILVEEGDTVSADSVVATLDDRVLQTSLQVALAGAAATGQLESAIAEVERTRDEMEKLLDLRSRNHASQQEVSRVRTQLRIAECRVQTVREELEVRDLECKRIRAQIDQRRVRSPIDGIVTEINREPGEFVSLSDAVVLRVVQLDPLLIVFDVPIERRNDLSKEQRVLLQLGDENVTAEGIVEYVSPTVDSSNSAVRVKVRLPNENGQWSSGERVSLLLDQTPPNSQTEISPLASRQK